MITATILETQAIARHWNAADLQRVPRKYERKAATPLKVNNTMHQQCGRYNFTESLAQSDRASSWLLVRGKQSKSEQTKGSGL